MLGAWWAALLLAAVGQMGDLDAPRPKAKQLVMYASDAQVVTAGKLAVLELRFRVQDGYHVNSHHPASELEIPTAVELAPDVGVRVETAQYPAGKPYTLALDPSQTLDVYTGEFAGQLLVVAKAGSHELHVALRYQACDRAACYPVKTLPLEVVFTAK